MPCHPNVSKTATKAASLPLSSRTRKRGPSNADDSKQNKPKRKKQHAEEETDNEEETKEQGSVRAAKKGKKGKIR